MSFPDKNLPLISVFDNRRGEAEIKFLEPVTESDDVTPDEKITTAVLEAKTKRAAFINRYFT